MTSGYQTDVIGPNANFQCSLHGPDVVTLPKQSIIHVKMPSLQDYPMLPDHHKTCEDMMRATINITYLAKETKKQLYQYTRMVTS